LMIASTSRSVISPLISSTSVFFIHTPVCNTPVCNTPVCNTPVCNTPESKQRVFTETSPSEKEKSRGDPL
jgi:hypothetical protein